MRAVRPGRAAGACCASHDGSLSIRISLLSQGAQSLAWALTV